MPAGFGRGRLTAQRIQDEFDLLQAGIVRVSVDYGLDRFIQNLKLFVGERVPLQQIWQDHRYGDLDLS